MEITKKIDGYLREFVSELDQEDDVSGIKPTELSSLDTGIRRIQYRLGKANTPQKYKDAFNMIHQLAQKFPMRQKMEIIMRTIADTYDARFGAGI